MKRGRTIQAIEAALNAYHDGCPRLSESTLREILKVLRQDRGSAMALLDRPLTTEEVRKLMDLSPSAKLYSSVMMELITSTRYQTVRYRGAINRTDYERPDTFYALGPQSPSDSVWMIPNGIGALVNG